MGELSPDKALTFTRHLPLTQAAVEFARERPHGSVGSDPQATFRLKLVAPGPLPSGRIRGSPTGPSIRALYGRDVG
jgi:hypothetical protein